MILRTAFGVGTAVIMAAVLAPDAARAESTYRYWSYWVGGDSWTYAARGPGFRVPPDGGVEGYRFVVSPKDGSQATAPGTAATYDQLCPGQPAAPAGQKRVAIVLDFGPAGIAPVGETTPATSVQCVTVEQSATGLQAVQKVAQLRFHTSGLICGIAGFPAVECPGQTVRTASPTPSAASPSPAVSAPPAAAPTVVTDVTTPSVSASPSLSPTVTPSPSELASDMPSPVAVALDAPPPPAPSAQTPAWIAAIGAGMIAALLGLALLARRGRE